MGLILDSSVLIAEERKGQTARQALTQISGYTGENHIAVSVITIMEMAHGLVRANTPERKATRQQFLTDVMQAIPVYRSLFQLHLERAALMVKIRPSASASPFLTS
jgi:tRNA(fMet)-specific endonuclease VapC